MRPIENSPVPKDNAGNPKSYSNYQEWRRDLADTYGQHCVFCNDRLSNKLEVEHLIAKSLGIVPPLNWDNLSLACGPCNLAKLTKLFDRTTHFLPNSHNTYLAFDFVVRPHKKLKGKYACIPIPNKNLLQLKQDKAAVTIKDLELDRVEQTAIKERKMTDVRWQNRYDAFQLVQQQRKLWNSLSTAAQKDEYKQCIPPMLNRSGFFSLWVKEFIDVPEILAVIITSLPNTATSVFPAANNYQPVERITGDL